MASLEEKQARVLEATASGYRGRILAQGQARGMIWREGVLPENAPSFSDRLSYDLLSYGYSLLSDGLDILDEDGDQGVARIAFEVAAGAIESVVGRGEENQDRDFHRFIAASSYHLARYSARAYSLLSQASEDPNYSLPERAVSLLMMRDMEELGSLIASFGRDGAGDDASLVEALASALDPVEVGDGSEGLSGIVDVALTDNFFSAMATAMLAFERGDSMLLNEASELLRDGLSCAGDLNFVPHWWCHRLAIYLIGDLWSSSFHVRLPDDLGGGGQEAWQRLRELFIASLSKRSRAEINLWPSQLDASARALESSDNLVVSLPTSAGKTRIAEICILACLAAGRRVVFLTPLRALSAQTEATLGRTFAPLGKSVSSLYGSIGVGALDENVLREQDIIVATPEKLDFALRSEPELLDDVGLVVLDEGHMIGLGEREVRYEVQIQKLLRRADSATRRIVCLSAILPDDDKLDDFVGWLAGDGGDGLVEHDWRPTRLRFGTVEWRGDHGWLQLEVAEEHPFVPRFIEERDPTAESGRRKAKFPRDQRELCLATAWRLVEDGQSVLLFCPLRTSVEPFAETIVDLHDRGFLPSVLTADEGFLTPALTIGAEWFGGDHPILRCLELGVAVHHGALPTPYRREVERLLQEGILKITVSSPTLAQGLNLSATALLFHSLHRRGRLIEVSEFRNVVGRAGRAFVDVEGLVLYPMFGKVGARKEQWQGLVNDSGGKEMESGLLRLVQYLLRRMIRKHAPKDINVLREYVVNGSYWEFPELDGESEQRAKEAATVWPEYVAMLDTAILGLIGDGEVAEADLEPALDAVLQSSLWSRRLDRTDDATQAVLKEGLLGRARLIWAQSSGVQRRAYFLAGVGLSTGQMLDSHADALVDALIAANGSVAAGDAEAAIAAFVTIAEILFEIPPFAPKAIPQDWKEILTVWLNGKPISSLESCGSPETLKFIEETLIYRLPWGMEATRVRSMAHGTDVGGGLTLDDLDLGLAVPALETGTLSVPVALLIKAGFSSRAAAIAVVDETGASFGSFGELRAWLRSDRVRELSSSPNWPTPETAGLWAEFAASIGAGRERTWKRSEATLEVVWEGASPASGEAVRVELEGKDVVVATPAFKRIGRLASPLPGAGTGVMKATVAADGHSVDVTALGPVSLSSG